MHRTILGMAFLFCVAVALPAQRLQCSSAVLPLVVVDEKADRTLPVWSAADFAVTVDKLPVQIEELRHEVFPRSTMILLDESASMQGSAKKKVGHSAAVMLAQQSPEGPVTLATYSDKISNLLDMRAALASGKDSLQLFGVDAKDRRTATYDAILSSARQMPRLGPEDMIILITDGADNISKANYPEVVSTLRQQGIRLFVVFLRGTEWPPRTIVPEETDSAELEELVKDSGGLFLSVLHLLGSPRSLSDEDLAKVLSSVSRAYTRVNHSYRLSFSIPAATKHGRIRIKTPSNFPDGMALYYPRRLAGCPATSN